MTHRLIEHFRRRHGVHPAVSRAPGRVNLIGEHTEYNGGFVMPAALEFATWAAAAPRSDRSLCIHSTLNDDEVTVDLDHLPARRGHWSDYVIGVAVMLQRAGYSLCGTNLMISSTVPVGSGLSSSAALEVATGHALVHAAGGKIDPVALAKIGQQAENDFVGMRCGIMDQYISACGREGAALLIDCRSLAARPVTVPDSAALVVIDSKVHHQHAGGEYNLRRQACEEGVARLQPALPGISQLRDVSVTDLERHGGLLPDMIFRRCRHIVTENQRVLDGETALNRGDGAAFGQLMRQSHSSMRDDFEITCAEVDLLADLANAEACCHGARMTGGGFGGCVVALVAANEAEGFMNRVTTAYAERTGLKPMAFACHPGPGVGLVS
jgi:galactokinase